MEDITQSFSDLLAENPFFGLFLVLIIIGALGWVGILALRYALHKWFEIPLSLNKKVLQILVPKESAKKEEEDKSSKKDYKELIAVMESFYSGLGHLKPKLRFFAFFIGREDHISLEIAAIEGLVKFFIVVPAHMQQFFEQQLHAQYPSAKVEEVEDYNLFRPRGVIIGAPIVATKASMFRIRTYKTMDSDPLNALTNAMSKVESTQGAAIQLVIRTARRGWGRRGVEIARKVQKGKSLKAAMQGPLAGFVDGLAHTLIKGTSDAVFSPDKKSPPMKGTEDPYPRHSPMEQELIKSIEEKASKGGFETSMRVVTSADDERVAKMHLHSIANAFSQYLAPESGITLRKKKYFYFKGSLIKSFIYRRFDHRRKFIFSTEELASLYHFPLSTTETPNIQWLHARTAPPPVDIPQEGIILGESIYRGKRTLIRMKREDRRRHMYVVGTTGVGKTTIMENMIIQDIQNGEGCGFIDPHGEAVKHILENIPPERADDVVLFDPSDTDRPVGLNMLQADTPAETDFAIQEMIAIFYKLVTDPSMIGPMFEHYMRNAMLTLMSDPVHPGTIVEIPRILTDRDYQTYKLQTVTDPIVRAFWEKELPQTAGQTKGEMLPYLVSKIGRFIENVMMRNIIGQEHSGFDFREVMDRKKILLVNLSKGQVGEINSNLLGLVVVSKLQMAALARADMPSEKRHDFFLYIDEFQNFITDSIATILSEARKYRLNLVLGHQYIGQLVPKQGDTKVRDAVFGNVGTICAYRVGVDDAELMAKQLAPVFNEYDVINTEKYTANLRLLIDNTAARPFSMRTFPPLEGDVNIAEAIRQLARLKYGRDRALVEAEILERSQLG
ncbi:type IV secretion system DNA-binding domain-containing protein [Candidatus Uhrbacteria bacterium]|nr:type IV secretion system DNA-binding domain-containing protein [Candidatus Uhrbacteria bacterium]